MTGFIQSVFDILVRGEIIVLDGYWSYCVRVGHCAAPLVLRYSVPAAGTAAAFAMLVGWSDVRSLYGVVLAGGDEVYRDLVALVEHLKTAPVGSWNKRSVLRCRHPPTRYEPVSINGGNN